MATLKEIWIEHFFKGSALDVALGVRRALLLPEETEEQKKNKCKALELFVKQYGKGDFSRGSGGSFFLKGLGLLMLAGLCLAIPVVGLAALMSIVFVVLGVLQLTGPAVVCSYAQLAANSLKADLNNISPDDNKIDNLKKSNSSESVEEDQNKKMDINNTLIFNLPLQDDNSWVENTEHHMTIVMNNSKIN